MSTHQRVSKLDRETANQCLREWLKVNLNVSEREFVGVGFMNLKEMIFQNGTMTNTKVTILDSNYTEVVQIRTYEYGGPFKSKWRIRANAARRYDAWGTVQEMFNKGFDYLRNLFLQMLGFATVTGAIAGLV